MNALAAATVPQLPLATLLPLDSVRWFCPWGCVAARGQVREVWIGGTLIGQFHVGDRERGVRNVLLVTLAGDPTMHLGRLAEAFGLTDEYLRLLRRKAEAGGLGAVFSSRMGGQSKVTPQKRQQLRAWFAEGLTPTEAYRRQARRGRLSRATVSRERACWQAEQVADDLAATVTAATAAAPVGAAAIPVEVAAQQLPLLSAATTEEEGSDAINDETPVVVGGGRDGEQTPPAADEAEAASVADESVAGEPVSDEAAGDEQGPIVPMRSRPVQSGRSVQHLGTWMMMALAQRHGLHESIAASGARGDQARIATVATIAALASGEGCVEGVRRLQTPTAATLLRAERAPDGECGAASVVETGQAGRGRSDRRDEQALHRRVARRRRCSGRLLCRQPLSRQGRYAARRRISVGMIARFSA